MRAATKLQAVKDRTVTANTDIIAAVRYNRRLWIVFASALGKNENPLPAEIKRNVANLAAFVLNRSRTIETSLEPNPDRVSVLININRQLAAGLRNTTPAAA